MIAKHSGDVISAKNIASVIMTSGSIIATATMKRQVSAKAVTTMKEALNQAIELGKTKFMITGKQVTVVEPAKKVDVKQVRKPKKRKQTKAQRQLKQKFDALEEEFIGGAKDPKWVEELWDVMDFNDNQIVSLAEIDKLMVQRYPVLNCKPALMRAYKQTCLKEGGDGDAWVEPDEFPMLLVNLFYFNKLFQIFDQVDTDDDRRLDPGEFWNGLESLGMNLTKADADDEFAAMGHSAMQKAQDRQGPSDCAHLHQAQR